MVDKEGDAEARIAELEATVASLTKQNTKLKNELRFTTETERWAGLPPFPLQAR